MDGLSFHHQKYFEIDGYDEIILIDEKLHRKLQDKLRKKLSTLPADVYSKVIQRSRLRRKVLNDFPMKEFQGAFCLLMNYKRVHYTKDGKVYK